MAAFKTKDTRAEVIIAHGSQQLPGELTVPSGAAGLVVFAHGSGSSRHSPRNQFVAHDLQKHGLATLLFDLLTAAEEREEQYTGYLRFDIPLLADRLTAATRWVFEQSGLRGLPAGFFGSSTGAAAALVTAVHLGDKIKAVVSRGGRPDLAGEFLAQVHAPTLLMVGGNDTGVIELNRQARAQLQCESSLSIVPGASHLFEEPGALEKVAELATAFFVRHFNAMAPAN